MEEITPDLVARVASRIYNEKPQSPAPDSLVSQHPGPHSTFGHGASFPSEQAGAQLPVPPISGNPPAGSAWPGASGIPSIPAVASRARSVLESPPVPQEPALPTSEASLPGLGNFPNPAFTPDGFGTPPSFLSGQTASSPHFTPSGFHAPSALGSIPHATTTTSSGLSQFVQRIRHSHELPGQHGFSGQQGFGSVPARLRDQLSLNKHFASHGARPLDVPAIRKEFPILQQRVHGKPLAWLDNAATTQKPQCVIDAISRFYAEDNSNIHRGAHTLAARATDAYEQAREKVRAFLGASSVKEIVFVRGTTEGINLVAQTYGRKFLQPGDEIVLSTLEHHANIVPWQMVAKEKGAILRIIPVNDHGEILLEEYQRLLGPRTKLVSLTQASNSLGTILPVAEMTQMAKRYNARVLIDGAQSVAHIPVNLQQLGSDFFVFSGHKIFGPTGIGAVYIKEELQDILPPWQGGGSMIRNVTFEETTYSDPPAKYEAGTPNIADAVGLGAALDYVNRLGLPNIAAYEHQLLEYATECLSRIGGLRLIGTAREKVGVLSFVLPNRRTEEVGRMLDHEGIAVRSGHHCSQPALRRFGVESTVRPSLSFYNTQDEIDRLVDAVKRIRLMP